MCGICGILAQGGNPPPARDILERMCGLLYHRGPDDHGIYLDDRIGLGIRRLSIIDLPGGHQPLCNEDGTLWLVFNGEIYNFRELRRRLEQQGHVFRTNTDSEVILHAYETYGDACVDAFNGMFAFALWDVAKQRLLLARDRLGIKPLYYSLQDGELVFASELRALITHPDVPRELDPIAVDQLLTLEYTLAPRSILQHVRKLPAGHRLILESGRARLERYWEISQEDVPDDEDDCIERLRWLIEDAVRLRLVSDVPVGVLLSGGIDSSSILYFASGLSTKPLQSFSIGFADQSYNELGYARMTAERFGTLHHEEILQPDFAGMAEKLVIHLGEPLGDFSIFPTYLVSAVAAQHVKVVLTGDGGDELFAGYDTYVAQALDGLYGRLPSRLRRGLFPAMMARVPPTPAKKGFVNKTKRFVEGAALEPALEHVRWMTFLAPQQREALYQPWLKAALNGTGAAPTISAHFAQAPFRDPLGRQQYVDVKTYLADNILTKVDRMSMANSLEARVPLLDHRIVAFALNLPAQLKLRQGRTKHILRQAMANRIPAAILDKPKEGFSIPLKHWLRGPLRPLMGDLLTREAIQRRGYFEPETVTQWIDEHTEGRANHSHRLWGLMVFELWCQQVLDRK